MIKGEIKIDFKWKDGKSDIKRGMERILIKGEMERGMIESKMER